MCNSCDVVTAQYVGDYGDETFGVGDCGVARNEDEGYDDYGEGVVRSEHGEAKLCFYGHEA